MAINQFLTPQWYTTDVAMFFNGHARFINQCDRSYADDFHNKPGGAQIGYTVFVRTPQRFQTSEGDALVESPLLNTATPLTVNHHRHVGHGWSQVQKTMEIEEVQSRYSMPQGKALATVADNLTVAEVYQSIYFSIGVPGATGATTVGSLANFQTWLDGVAKLENANVPGPYVAIIDPKTQAKLVGSSFIQFNPQKRIGEYFETGEFADAALGIDKWVYDSNMPTQTTGTFTSSTPVVSGALQTGSTLVISGMGTYNFLGGEQFTILGVNAMQPLGFSDTGDIQTFTIVAPTSGAGTATLSITPAIITSGPLGTVMNSPANNAQVFFLGATNAVAGTLSTITSRQSIVMNAAAVAFAMVDISDDCPGATAYRKSEKESKISMLWTEQFNVQTFRKSSRVDIMWGSAAIMPMYGFRCWA